MLHSSNCPPSLSSAATTHPARVLLQVRKNAHVEIVPLSTGCLGACTYCKTKHARGQLGSYRLEAIVRRVAAAAADPMVSSGRRRGGSSVGSSSSSTCADKQAAGCCQVCCFRQRDGSRPVTGLLLLLSAWRRQLQAAERLPRVLGSLFNPLQLCGCELQVSCSSQV